MVINNAILWELNELVGNLRPELHTHIRLIMLRADYLKGNVSHRQFFDFTELSSETLKSVGNLRISFNRSSELKMCVSSSMLSRSWLIRILHMQRCSFH